MPFGESNRESNRESKIGGKIGREGAPKDIELLKKELKEKYEKWKRGGGKE